MKSNQAIFEYHEHSIRTVQVGGGRWFSASDVATALGSPLQRRLAEGLSLSSQDMTTIDVDGTTMPIMSTTGILKLAICEADAGVSFAEGMAEKFCNLQKRHKVITGALLEMIEVSEDQAA